MNKALTSDRKIMDHCRPIALANYKLLTLALIAAGYDSDRFVNLQPSCDYSRPELEERKEEWVELYLNALGLGVDLDTMPDINDCALTLAEDIEVPGSYASLVTSLTGSNNDLYFRAKQWGPIGNIYRVEYLDPDTIDYPLTIHLEGSTISVKLKTDHGGVIRSTASEIKAAIENNSDCDSLVEVNLVTNNTGAGAVTVMPATNFTGGSN